jgi:hypothetical protein
VAAVAIGGGGIDNAMTTIVMKLISMMPMRIVMKTTLTMTEKDESWHAAFHPFLSKYPPLLFCFI